MWESGLFQLIVAIMRFSISDRTISITVLYNSSNVNLHLLFVCGQIKLVKQIICFVIMSKR